VHKLLIFVLAIGFSGSAFCADIFKCKGLDGAITFSDKPCGSDPVRVSVDQGHGDIEVSEDRFAGVTNYRSKGGEIGLGKPMTIQTVVNSSIKTFTAQLILTGGYRGGWKYLDCHSTTWLIDGKPQTWPAADHIGKAGSGLVVEGISQTIPTRDALAALGSAGRVEYKICNDEGEMTSSELSDLKRIVRLVNKQMELKKVTEPPH
jgi:hypothetical protein